MSRAMARVMERELGAREIWDLPSPENIGILRQMEAFGLKRRVLHGKRVLGGNAANQLAQERQIGRFLEGGALLLVGEPRYQSVVHAEWGSPRRSGTAGSPVQSAPEAPDRACA